MNKAVKYIDVKKKNGLEEVVIRKKDNNKINESFSDVYRNVLENIEKDEKIEKSKEKVHYNS